MITFRPQGRLANFMLEAFTAYAHAKKHGEDFTLPVHTYSDYFPKLPQGEVFSGKFVYYEPEHSYREIPNHHNMEIVGFFQSPKYFDDYRQELIDDFGFRFDTIPDTVALHIRRGDYLLYPDKHPVVTVDYIRKAIDIFCLMDKKDLTFSVFSDDIVWCKENLNDEFWSSFQYKYKVEFIEPEGDIEDMKYMSMHENFIISNSTYSYMAAYLSQSKNKVVVCPHEDNHFGDNNKHLDVKDYYPENQNWIKIKY